MDHFPNLPKDPTPTPPPMPRPSAKAPARPAKGFNLMYVWIGLAVAGFGAVAYWGMLRPSESGASASEIIVPNIQTAAERAESDALAALARRMREQQEASRVIVLDGSKNPPSDPKKDDRVAVSAANKDMIIKFTPPANPSTRPATVGGRTKPFLAPDIAEDGSFFGQIDTATGKPKTVYSSNQRKYLVE